jgi:thiamine-phosphate pyrophosphorylase
VVEVAPTPNYRANLAHVLGVYLVTDEASCAGRRLTDVVMAAVQGGASCVQLREKNLSTRNFCAKAIALQALLAPLGVALVINDRVDIALACGAPGVHLGQSDMPVAIARRLLPPAVFLGLSVETLAQVAQAATAAMAGVDYLGVSPVFATPTKTDTSAPWGLAGLRQVRMATTLPLVAIGGIHAGNAADVLAAGADGLAVVSAICRAKDPALAAHELRTIWEKKA